MSDVIKKDFFLLRIDNGIKLNFAEIFGNNNPIVVEIGSGKGEFVKEMSIRYSEVNFLCFELKERRNNIAIRELDIGKNRNIRFIMHYVDSSIDEIIDKDAIMRVIINHPDPWPKRRHHKHRLINNEFLDTLYYLLKPEGVVQIATDHQGYSEWIIKHFENDNRFEFIFEGGFSKTPSSEHIVTYFETIKRKEGFEPIFMHFRKVL